MAKRWIQWLLEGKRPWCLAALAVVLLWSLWPGLKAPAMPGEGEAAMAPPPAESKKILGLQLARQTEKLQDPFSVWHPYQAEKGMSPAAGAAGRPQTAAGPPAAEKPRHSPESRLPQAPLRLVGILTSEQGTLAVFSRNGRQFTLAPGERQADICLEAVEQGQAIVDTGAGRQRLKLAD